MFCKLALVFIVFTALFSFSQQASILQSTSGVVYESEYDLVSWGSRRSVAEDVTDVSNSSLILAKERTYRKDPSDGFKYYKRGWNISESHYIYYSLAFTAAPLFLIAALWFVGFGLCLLLLCLFFCCCQRRSYGYSRTAYALSLILLSLFTVAAIAGSVVWLL